MPSATTAHAVMQLNAEDGGNRKFIMVQLPEPYDESSEAYNAGYKSIADLQPLKVVFKGTSFKDDKNRINVKERFKRLSPETRITVL